MDDNEMMKLMREAQPAWVKDGKGVRGDAVTQVNTAKRQPRDTDAFTGQVVKPVIIPF